MRKTKKSILAVMQNLHEMYSLGVCTMSSEVDRVFHSEHVLRKINTSAPIVEAMVKASNSYDNTSALEAGWQQVLIALTVNSNNSAWLDLTHHTMVDVLKSNAYKNNSRDYFNEAQLESMALWVKDKFELVQDLVKRAELVYVLSDNRLATDVVIEDVPLTFILECGLFDELKISVASKKIKGFYTYVAIPHYLHTTPVPLKSIKIKYADCI